MSRHFKIGIVGCGRISQTYIQAIESSEAIDLVALLDTRPETVRSAAESAGCKAFTDLEAFCEESGVEAAIICAPPSCHRPIACRLMDSGIHVLCEKPFATNLQDAEAMVRAAEEKDLILMMASKFRYVEDIIRAKAMVSSGMLGDILFFENCFCSKVSMADRWNSNPQIAGGGVIIDNGTHSVDIVRYLLGPIRSIHVLDGKRVMGLPVEETASMSFSTHNGAMGNINLSWSISVALDSYITLLGTEGKLRVGWQESLYQHNGHKEWVSFGVGYDKVDAFQKLIGNFIDTVRGFGTPIISLQDALASVRVIEAAYESMRNHRQWPVEENVSDPCVVIAT